jgi:magnesium transporter
LSKRKISPQKRGMSPGSLIFTGEKKTDKVKITLIQYDSNKFESKEIINLEELEKIKESKAVNWINIAGLHDTAALQTIGEIFQIHLLVLEDILNVEHNPKFDDYDNHLFVITKMIDYNKEANALNIEHLSFILGENYLLTFQENEEDVFDVIRDRIKNGKGRIRNFAADYLMYRLIDAVVDNYYFVLENLDDKLEIMEDHLLENPDSFKVSSLHIIKKDILKIRRSVSPLLEIIHSFEREKGTLLKKSTYVFLRDLYDHSKQIIELTENYRELINGMVEIYLSSASQRMNEVIKLLTIISTIFIPLTFIVGIYGMNFNTKHPLNMPELHWALGYPAVMLFMLLIAVGLIIFFKRKRWL